jgi:hypothetical protein
MFVVLRFAFNTTIMVLKLISICVLSMLLVKAACRNTQPAAGNETEMRLRVYHYKVPCVGESVQLCYRVEQQEGQPEYFYDAIEGFQYEWGYNYTLIVIKQRQETALPDASAFTYRLKTVMKKEIAAPEETFELPLRLDEQPLVENKNGSCLYAGTVPVETGDYTCSDLAAAQSAVFRHGNNNGLTVVKLK